MTGAGVVFDLGYQPHEGPRLGRSAILWAIVRDGLRRVLGLRRRARRKILPWGLIAVALVPVTFFVAIGVVVGELAEDAELFGHAQYFDLTGVVALVFVALASAELLVPDREQGVLSVYASRPLTTADYLSARAVALAILVLGFLFIPHVLLYLGQAWVSPDGFLSYLTSHFGDLWRSGLASIGYLFAYAPLGFAIASVSTRSSMAAGGLIGVAIVSNPAAAALVNSGIDAGGLLAVMQHPSVVKDWLLGASGDWIPQEAGFGPLASAVVIAVVAAVCVWFVARRYRRVA